MQYPIPAVRLFVKNDAGKVLLLKRAAASVGGSGWCLPGGKVDFGETIAQAAKKELFEETNLKCTALRILFYQDSLPTETLSDHYINFYFEADAEGKLRLNSESEDFAWIGEKEMTNYAILFRNDEALRKYFE
ncbi:MAG: NUDIX hydrolase [Calditrichaeota bacterium]|nr:MAG: NUDIX hydrolase [Calditrichota bacterium]